MRLIGRDITKSIIVDNIAENFDVTTPDNGIHIKNFEGEFDDDELYKLKDFLLKIAQKREDDVRTIIKRYREDYTAY